MAAIKFGCCSGGEERNRDIRKCDLGNNTHDGFAA